MPVGADGAMPAAMAAGVWLGRHIDLKISREQLARLLNLLLIASGASLLLRFAL